MPDESSDERLTHDIAKALAMSLTVPEMVRYLRRAGWGFLNASDEVPFDVIAFQIMKQDAWAALGMIRDVVEDYAPSGSVSKRREALLVDEAQALIRGIVALAESNQSPNKQSG